MLKTCHQQAANLNDSDQTIEFVFGENNNCHQVGIAYLQYELTIEKDVAVAANRSRVNGDGIRLVNNAFAYCFKEARSITTEGSYIEHNKYCGQFSTNMEALPSIEGDLLSHFEENDESEAETENTALLPHLINNHDLPVNNGKLKDNYHWNKFLDFVRLLRRLLNN